MNTKTILNVSKSKENRFPGHQIPALWVGDGDSISRLCELFLKTDISLELLPLVWNIEICQYGHRNSAERKVNYKYGERK